ncbi:hypothetical protein C8F04DRAFT_1260531 [Mycena alexandri]|uniref:Secreted protein n=1 Tax=Mycena alexandri TaxID=1745969 RepID=A0AAD6SW58_9AGAR|nr:hypothetical protein C8F04DRAFT_1260531 [Mycena alexandri]
MPLPLPLLELLHLWFSGQFAVWKCANGLHHTPSRQHVTALRYWGGRVCVRSGMWWGYAPGREPHGLPPLLVRPPDAARCTSNSQFPALASTLAGLAAELSTPASTHVGRAHMRLKSRPDVDCFLAARTSWAPHRRFVEPINLQTKGRPLLLPQGPPPSCE